MKPKYFHIVLAIWLFAVGQVGFSESFTNRPTASGMGDIVEGGIVGGNAVYEREMVVSYTNTFLPYCGHGQSYFASLQQELETMAPIYIDHENGPLTDEEDDFLYFDLDNWRAAAGLNASGFRRSTDGTTFYYDQMQAGDIIGSWIFEDLQNGFGALRWTSKTGSFTNRYIREVHINENEYIGMGCEEKRVLLKALWDAASWLTTSGTLGQGVYIDAGYLYSPDITDAWRVKGSPFVDGVPSDFAANVECWLYSPSWTVYQTFSNSSETSYTANEYYGSDEFPLDTFSIYCPIDDGGYGGSIDNPVWIFKWDFTNE